MDQPAPAWTAGVLLFSGRRDPTWNVSSEAALRLLELWRRLPTAHRVPPERSVLGYRGCWLRSPEGARLLARDGVVVDQGSFGAGPPIARDDAARTFEQALLATAPPGSLPSELQP